MLATVKMTGIRMKIVIKNEPVGTKRKFSGDRVLKFGWLRNFWAGEKPNFLKILKFLTHTLSLKFYQIFHPDL